jgi:hypothetical protein
VHLPADLTGCAWYAADSESRRKVAEKELQGVLTKLTKQLQGVRTKLAAVETAAAESGEQPKRGRPLSAAKPNKRAKAAQGAAPLVLLAGR